MRHGDSACVFTREELRELHSRSIVYGLSIFLLDFGCFVGTTIFILLTDNVFLQIPLSVIAGLFIGLLFVVGHDACHQGLTPYRWLNRIIGTLAFLPSLHPFSLWDLGHNRIHHRFTNVRKKDYVWEPLDYIEYRNLTRLAKLRYRFFRTFVGHFWYYLVEIWWKKMFYPRSKEIYGYRLRYITDLIFVTGWIVFWTIVLVALKSHYARPETMVSYVWMLLVAFVLPLIVFNLSMSTVIYLHHTHPRVYWVREDACTDASKLQMQSSVHVVFPFPVNWLLHRIMEHTAHHLRPGIPLYRLQKAQTLLESHSDEVIVQKWSFSFHLDTLQRCKLFDIQSRCWTDYSGIRTTNPDAETALSRMLSTSQN